jgi:hypothetical protein
LVLYPLINFVVVPNDYETPPIIAVSVPLGLELQEERLSGKCNKGRDREARHRFLMGIIEFRDHSTILQGCAITV